MSAPLFAMILFPSAHSADGVLSSGAPATVLEHSARVAVDSSARLTTSVTWRVRIDDPEACAAGVQAPPGLDGAIDGSALVLEDLLVVPADVAPGTVYTLSSRSSAPAGSHSGLFVGSTDLPAEQTRLEIQVPKGVPLTVWADPEGAADHALGRTRRITMTWPVGVAAPQAAWSTYRDWSQADGVMRAAVQRRLGGKPSLGRELASSIEGLGIAGLVELAVREIEVDPGALGDFRSSRRTSVIRQAGSGTAAERALVLLTLLHVAGFDARRVSFRAVTAPGTFPMTVPVPDALDQPGVVVYDGPRTVYVDPSLERPTAHMYDNDLQDVWVPASMRGATVWVPGRIPTVLQGDDVHDGSVLVDSTVSVDGYGDATFRTVIHATGAAREILRDRLAPLDGGGQNETLARLVGHGHPTSDGVAVSASALGDPAVPVEIRLSGRIPGLLESRAYGHRGTVPAVLAPALAAWLPPRLSIEESMVVDVPTGTRIIGASVQPASHSAEAQLGRSLDRRPAGVVLRITASRPDRRTTPATDAAAAAFLTAQARLGVDVLAVHEASRSVARSLRSDDDLHVSETNVLEAALWFGSGNVRRGEKVVRRSGDRIEPSLFVDALETWWGTADLTPWDRLIQQHDDDDEARVAVVEGLEAAGAHRRAREVVTSLLDSEVASVRVRALVALERLQGPPPIDGPDLDWQHPSVLADAALAAFAESSDVEAAVRHRLAGLCLQQGDSETAEALLEPVRSSPLKDLQITFAEGIRGLSVDAVRMRVGLAVAAAPADPRVLSTAAGAMSGIGDLQMALGHSLTAARLRYGDPSLWTAVVDHALKAGDLPQAVLAARHASDLDPSHRNRAQWWAELASAWGRPSEIADARAQIHRAEGTPTLGQRMALVPTAPLAVLQASDTEVHIDPVLLELRSQMRIHAGYLDAAAQDGLILATRHGRVSGNALAFAATLGQQYSSPLLAALDRAASGDLTALMTRMEHRLVAASGDPLKDARAFEDSLRALSLIEATSHPDLAAARIEGWPEAVRAPRGPGPSGWIFNRALSAHPGVRAWSDPASSMAFVRVGQITGVLPPPLGLLYTPSPQPVEQLEQGVVLRLDGGTLPLYVATTLSAEGEELLGLGFTVQAAKRALAATVR